MSDNTTQTAATEAVHSELNLDTKVTVKNIADWNVGFVRKADGYGDVSIAPNGSIRLSRNEIIAQVQSGNKLFCGIDGSGSHATLYIEDAPTRLEVGFDTEDSKQKAFTNVNVKSLFAIKNQKDFESSFCDNIHTRAEKYAIIGAMKKAGINDYSKIRFVEQYTGYKFQ